MIVVETGPCTDIMDAWWWISPLSAELSLAKGDMLKTDHLIKAVTANEFCVKRGSWFLFYNLSESTSPTHWVALETLEHFYKTSKVEVIILFLKGINNFHNHSILSIVSANPALKPKPPAIKFVWKLSHKGLEYADV